MINRSKNEPKNLQILQTTIVYHVIFILSSKRSISTGIERKKSLKFWNLAAKLNGNFQPKWWMWWMHGWAAHKDFYHGCSLGNR